MRPPKTNLLHDYLERSGESHRAFAARAGIAHLHPMVSQWALSQARPGLEVAVAIEAATGGQIPSSWWLNVPQRKKARRAKRKQARRLSALSHA